MGVFYFFDCVEKSGVRHPGLPQDIRGLSGNTFWALRKPLLRSSMRGAGIESQMFGPYLAFVSSVKGMERDAFHSSLGEFFRQFEGVANLRSSTHTASALSDYRFWSSRGLSLSSRNLRETGLHLLANEITFEDDPSRALLLLIGMGDYAGARGLHEKTARDRDFASFEHLAISQLLRKKAAPAFRSGFLDEHLLSLVEGKKIYILGPGEGSDLGSQCASSDSLVLRFEEARRLPQLQRNVDIGWEDSNPSRKEPKFLGNQKVLLVNYPEHMGRFSGHLPHVVRQERFEGLGGYGLPLGAMRAALNLLPYGPSEIYMSGIDFFLSDSQYEPGYGGADQRDTLFHHWTLMHGHDLISNLHLGKALWLSGTVTGDERFLRAINTPAAVAARVYDQTYWNRLYAYISRGIAVS